MPPKSSPQSKKRFPQTAKQTTPVPPPVTQFATPFQSHDVILPGPAPAPVPLPPGAIAAVPMVVPPNASQPTTVRYGQLNSKPPLFYIQADLNQLRAMIQSAPATVQRAPPPDASYDYLLNEVLRIRQHEAVQAKQTTVSHQASLQQLMAMSTQQVSHLAESNPDHLKTLMHGALIADPTLHPRSFPLDNNVGMAGVAITWQFQSYRQAHQFQSHRPAVHPTPSTTKRVQFADIVPPEDDGDDSILPSLPGHSSRLSIGNLASMLRTPSNDEEQVLSDDSSEDNDNIERTSKKHKSYVVPQGFSRGAGATAPTLPKKYPGKDVSSKTVNVREFLGAKILATWLAGGTDLQTFLARINWRRTNAGLPSQSEIEAHTIGRAVHLEMLNCRTPKEALLTRPSLEVLLRRLYAILYVEEGINSRKYTDKGTAWSNIEFILETHPTRTMMCADISEEIAKQISIERRRANAVNQLEQTRAASRRRNNKPQPTNTPPPTPPRKHNYKR